MENKKVRQYIELVSVKSFERIIKGKRVGRITLNQSKSPERAELTAVEGKISKNKNSSISNVTMIYFCGFISIIQIKGINLFYDYA